MKKGKAPPPAAAATAASKKLSGGDKALPADKQPKQDKGTSAAVAAVMAAVVVAAPVSRLPTFHDTEACALDTLEWILEETFKFQAVSEYVSRKVHFSIDATTSNIFSTIHMGCSIEYDARVPPVTAEDEPDADAVDRHAVLTLPKKQVSAHPRRLYEDPTNVIPLLSVRTASERSLVMRSAAASAAAGGGRRRTSLDSFKGVDDEQPVVFRIPAKVDYLDKETKAWRIKCMTELSSAKQKKAKWGKVSVLRHTVGQRGDFDMCDNTFTAACDEGASEGGGIETAPMDALVTTLDTVRTIPDTNQTSTHDAALLLINRPATAPEPTPCDERGMTMGEEKTTVLPPSRSRRRHNTTDLLKMKKAPAKSNWFFEKISLKDEIKQERSDAYKPHVMELQRETFAQSIELNPGVSLVQGLSKYLGPQRKESPTTMSRKGFQKQLRAVGLGDPNWDAANNGNGGPNRVRLSALPLPHLPDGVDESMMTPSTSTPDLRPPTILTECDTTNTRSAADLTKSSRLLNKARDLHASSLTTTCIDADDKSGRPSREQYVTHGDSVGVPEIPSFRRRPSTAIGALLASGLPPPSSAPSSSSSKAPTSKLKYIREFPSPKPEVVTVLKDDRQRMAWLS
ncbi:Aste57867_18490 [Aphanomyces stellatus]|uniref:Aste57867_18490 protein n=1 Tax=Aphanomyces stellatus TaxID=120398 RepID=A0A485LA85_9STRA|nr:hypothetical protein As57867_018428 [Aphanomyces stellatus]VFT95226.1 Aste57867_18490 [Aphanomyces stellatus]